jgi:MoaA/NifB/PqqE/SkfB family radical SAM enzyme
MDCPLIHVTGYGEFSERLHNQAATRRLPITGSVELTDRCNLQCAHCYINLSAADCESRSRELTLGEWRNLLDQIADEGCLWLLLTGGEPLIRPDFLEIYDHAKQRGLLLTVFTNGTLLTPRARRSPGRVAAVCYRDHALRAHAGSL